MGNEKILLVDDEPNITSALTRSFASEPWEIFTANSGEEGLEILSENDIDVVVSDEQMPGMSGSTFLTAVRKKYPQSIRMILTGQTGLDAAIRAINGGEVYRYFTKPCNSEELGAAIRQGLQHKKLAEKSRQLLCEYQKKSSILDKLEESDPGITQIETDEEGAILVETMEIELDELEAVSKILSDENDDTAELHKAEIVFKFVVMSCDQASEILQPGKQSFDMPATTVAT